jgi:hypothetical protein
VVGVAFVVETVPVWDGVETVAPAPGDVCVVCVEVVDVSVVLVLEVCVCVVVV